MEGLGGEVAPEGAPVRAVRHGVEVLAPLAAAPAGQGHVQARGRAVREGVGVLDECAVCDGRVGDLVHGE